MHVTFPCGRLTLEGELQPASNGRAAVICHPHPQYAGDMHNSVVCAIAAACEAAGLTTLRFNFRGTGRSTGAYANGIGEREDVRAAIAYVQAHTGAESVLLAGYSFGAMVAIQTAPDVPIDGLIAVAPPLSFFDLRVLDACTVRKLFIVGDDDQYCSVAQLHSQLAQVAEPKAVQVLSGADHFFGGNEPELRAAIAAWIG